MDQENESHRTSSVLCGIFTACLTFASVPALGMDFDGDGITDFAVWRPMDGTWRAPPGGDSTASPAREDADALTRRSRGTRVSLRRSNSINMSFAGRCDAAGRGEDDARDPY